MKEINGNLTDTELHYEQGKEEELLNGLSQIMNMSPEEVKNLIESVSFNESKVS